MAFEHLPNEVFGQIFQFLSFTFLANRISIVSRRFSEISQLVLFPANDDMQNNEGAIKKKIYFYNDQFYAENNETRIPIPMPEVSPPANWKLKTGIIRFKEACCEDEELENFMKFLVDSGQMENCKIELGACTNLEKFDLEYGFFAPMRGKVFEFILNEFVIDDHCFSTGRDNQAPFSNPFLREIPQLRINLDNLIYCERQRELVFDPCRRSDLVDWLASPFSNSNASANSNSRKISMSSKNAENVIGMVGLIAMHFMHSSRPSPFIVFIHFQGRGSVTKMLTSKPCIHPITGEAFEIHQFRRNENEKRKFIIRRCPADQVAVKPTFFIDNNCCKFIFD